MGITKTAVDRDAFARPFRTFVNARSAFKAFLRALNFQDGEQVLLPAYVGWSSREGSGVFDPVDSLQLPFSFYRLDENLRIDLDDLDRRLRGGHVKVLVLIHYFGYVDPGYAEAVALARRRGVWVLEDEAHALLTDCVGGISGRLGDACIFSLHKMLPLPSGGMLVTSAAHRDLLDRMPEGVERTSFPGDYDLYAIAQRRRQNAFCLADLLLELAEDLVPLWGPPQPGEVPQTYPVLVQRVSRDELYTELNARGFGAVSLYHTLIEPIDVLEFPESHHIAGRILNLPVHQDVRPEQLRELVSSLAELLPTLTQSLTLGPTR